MKTRVKVFSYIRKYQRLHQYPPSVREIEAAIPEINSTSVVFYHLRELVKEGLLEYEPKKSRGLKILRTPVARLPRKHRRMWLTVVSTNSSTVCKMDKLQSIPLGPCEL